MRLRRIRIWSVILAWGVGGGLLSSATPAFNNKVSLPASGIRLRTFSRSSQLPPSPPRVFLYQALNGDTLHREERYDPVELWTHDQLLAQWIDPENNTMTLAVVNTSFPSGFRPHETLAEYQRTLNERSRDISGTNPHDLSGWVENFTGLEVSSKKTLRFLPFKINSAVHFPVSDPRQIIYLFQTRHRLPQFPKNRVNTFLVHLSLQDASQVDKIRESFEERFFETLEFFSPPQNTSSPSSEFQKISDLEDWWHIDTEGYTIISNQKLGNRQLIEDLHASLDPMRRAYESVIPLKNQHTERATVRIFSSPREYQAYVGQDMAWSGGVWNSSRRELVIRPVPSARYSETRERILRTIFHEAFHQYLYFAALPFTPAAWFNEGHAALFEFSRLKDTTLSFEEHGPYVERIGQIRLEDLLLLPYKQFYSENQKIRGSHYAAAWSFIYYLQVATATERGFPFSNFSPDYLDALFSGASEASIFRFLSEKYDLSRLQADYLDFWQSPSRRRNAEAWTISLIPRR